MHWSDVRSLWQLLASSPVSCWRLVRLKPIALRAFVWMVAHEALILAQVYPVKFWIDALGANSSQTFWFGLDRNAFLAMLAGSVFCLYQLGGWTMMRMDILRNSAAWLFFVTVNGYGNRKQLELSADWHVKMSGGDKESLLAKNHKKVDYLIDKLIFDILPLTLRVIFISAGMWFISWRFGLLALLTLATYAIVMLTNERIIAPLREDYRSYTKRIERSDSELAKMALMIKEQGIEADLAREHDDLLEEHWAKEVPRHARFRHLLMWQDRVVDASRSLFYLSAWWSFEAGLSLGTIVLASAWMERVYSNLIRFSEFQYVLNEGAEALRELVELFSITPAIQQPQQPQWPDRPQGRIELKNVSFSYPGNSSPTLHQVNLSIEPGAVVALVGESGDGKSTMAKLASHQILPTSGTVLVDGLNLNQIDDHRFRRQYLGLVSQSPGLLNRTVFDNISIVRPGSSLAEIEAAAQAADADRFIRELPNGYDTLVGDNGVMLSGGQQQRLAFARAILKRPTLLVLDEPTSSLDNISQNFIKQTIASLRRQCTVLLIAHRFSTVEMADLVVVLQKGRIIEIGTHDELMEHGGLYYRLRRLDADGLLTH